MPLVQTRYGGECPLGKFRIDIPAGAGCYDRDPVEACLECNFADLSSKGFDLEKVCQCPADMDRVEYHRLREQYAASEGEHTKKGFQAFVKENYRK